MQIFGHLAVAEGRDEFLLLAHNLIRKAKFAHDLEDILALLRTVCNIWKDIVALILSVQLPVLQRILQGFSNFAVGDAAVVNIKIGMIQQNIDSTGKPFGVKNLDNLFLPLLFLYAFHQRPRS